MITKVKIETDDSWLVNDSGQVVGVVRNDDNPAARTPATSTLVTASTNLTGGIEILGVTDGNNIAHIGDSRTRYGYQDWYKRIAGLADYKGLKIDFCGVGIAITTNADGTFEYSKSQDAFRWTAPSDTAGPWTSIPDGGGYMRIESGSADKWLKLRLRGKSYLPATDQTLTLTCTDVMYAKTLWSGYATQIDSIYRGGPTIYRLGAGGATAQDLVDMLPYLNREAKGAGIDVIRIGTNDITINVYTADQIFSWAKQVLDARIAAGRKLVVCGEPARWGTAVNTAMVAGQLATMIAYNKLLAAYCAARPSQTRYVDLYAISVDPAYVDGRPAANMLADTVHDGTLGSILFGNAIAAAIDSFGGVSPAPFNMRGDVLNDMWTTWPMDGAGGVPGTATTGTLPTGFNAGRSGGGTDLSAVVSIDSYPDHAGRRIKSVIAATTGTQSWNVTMANATLAALSMAVGDWFQIEADIEIDDGATGITGVDIYPFLTGATTIRTQITVPPEAEGRGIMRAKSPPTKIPAGCTAIQPCVYVFTSGAASATVKIGEVRYKKVTAPE